MSKPLPGDLVRVNKLLKWPMSEYSEDITKEDNDGETKLAFEAIGKICKVLSIPDVETYPDGFGLKKFEDAGLIFIELGDHEDWWPVHPRHVEVIFST